MHQPSNYRMSYEELLAMEQNIDHLLAFTERDVKWREIEFYYRNKYELKNKGLKNNTINANLRIV